jgi:hypothetical protein
MKRDGVLNDAELAVAWKAAFQIEWPFGPLLRLLILTGARREAARCAGPKSKATKSNWRVRNKE